MEISIQIEEKECIICLDDVKTEWRQLECQHQYHKQCIEDWITIKATCPLCMKNINDGPIEIVQHIYHSQMDITYSIAIKRFVVFVLCIIAVIVIMVVFSSYND
jgi:hypothetical protein